MKSLRLDKEEEEKRKQSSKGLRVGGDGGTGDESRGDGRGLTWRRWRRRRRWPARAKAASYGDALPRRALGFWEREVPVCSLVIALRFVY